MTPCQIIAAIHDHFAERYRIHNIGTQADYALCQGD